MCSALLCSAVHWATRAPLTSRVPANTSRVVYCSAFSVHRGARLSCVERTRHEWYREPPPPALVTWSSLSGGHRAAPHQSDPIRSVALTESLSLSPSRLLSPVASQTHAERSHWRLAAGVGAGARRLPAGCRRHTCRVSLCIQYVEWRSSL